MTGMMILILVLGVVVISEVKSQGADLEQRRLYGTEEAICSRGGNIWNPRRRKCIRSKRRPTPGETQAADQVSTTVSPTTASELIDGTCYEDDSSRLLDDFHDSATNTPDECIRTCASRGYSYAGVQYTSQCFCGNDEPPASRIRDSSQCGAKCSGDASLSCGGTWRMNIYITVKTDICKCLETDGGCALAYDTLVATIRTLSRQFYISFEFSAAKYVRGKQNVIDFTNQGFGHHWGSRIPIVDVLDNNQIIICFAKNEHPNWCHTITKDLELHTWYTLEITQEKAITGKYFYQVSLNGDVQQSQVNTYPAQFNNVRVYGSQGGDNSNGDRYQRLDGNIQNLYINPVGPSEPNC